MTANDLYEAALNSLGFIPIPSQEVALKALTRFAVKRGPSDVFLLNGYAGTGKTSVIGALVKALCTFKQQVVMLAPTGRAAKVAAHVAGVEASTIHRRIYHPVGNGLEMSIQLSPNRSKNALFIVDEASLITDSSSRSSVLSHLINHVYRLGEGCGMILVGDRAQLPPVGQQDSPAMDHARLKELGLIPEEVSLDVPLRQASESGVLHNATIVRQALMKALTPESPEVPAAPSVFDMLSQIPGLSRGGSGEGAVSGIPQQSEIFPSPTPMGRPRPLTEAELQDLECRPIEIPTLELKGFEDIRAVCSSELAECLSDSWGEVGAEETLLVTRSNRRANQFNIAVRNQVMYADEPLERGDRLVIAKNDYYWKSHNSQRGFISNGEIAIVQWIGKMEKMYGRHFVEVELYFPEDQSTIGAKLMLRSLMSEGPSIPRSEMASFYQTVCNAYPGGPNEKAMAAMNDPYFNALQAKYAYCVTCHKAQGGQWKHVYIDMGNIRPEAMDASFLRWLYTAMTRTTSRLFLVNPTLPTDIDEDRY